MKSASSFLGVVLFTVSRAGKRLFQAVFPSSVMTSS